MGERWGRGCYHRGGGKLWGEMQRGREFNSSWSWNFQKGGDTQRDFEKTGSGTFRKIPDQSETSKSPDKLCFLVFSKTTWLYRPSHVSSEVWTFTYALVPVRRNLGVTLLSWTHSTTMVKISQIILRHTLIWKIHGLVFTTRFEDVFLCTCRHT
jgi:hypothetical protein